MKGILGEWGSGQLDSLTVGDAPCSGTTQDQKG